MNLVAVTSLAERVSERLAALGGIEAVLLIGSWARGEGRLNSDLDLGIYYDPARPPMLDALRALARELDDLQTSETMSNFGDWGPWHNGGGSLQIEGLRVDWHYRDLSLARRLVAEAQDGLTHCHVQPGHPHGFHTHSVIGEIHESRVLEDRHGHLTALKAKTTPYPPRLKQTLTESLWEAEYSLEASRRSAARGEVFYVSGCLFRCAAILVQVLFAFNEQYFTHEKGAVERIDGFAKRPLRFGETVSAVLAKPGFTPTELDHSIQRLSELVAETHVLLSSPSGPSPATPPLN